MKFYLSGDNDEDSRLDMIEQGGVAYFPAPVIDFATSIEKVKSVSTIAGFFFGHFSATSSNKKLAIS